MTDMLNRYGFTTVVDTTSNLANTVALRERIGRGEVAGPRILTAGFALYPKNGIPIYLRDMPPDFLASLSQPASVEEALADVQANLDGGADATKLFLMTPQGDGRYAFMQPDIALAAADETHRRGLPVLAHPTDIEGINLAIEAGVDVLVHTTIGEGKTAWDAPLIEQMRAKNMAVVPTLQLFPYELKRAGLPQRIVDAATGDAVEQVRAYSKAGGQILFGTDVGYMTDYDPTEEYRLMARALSPMQILASLTTAPPSRWKEDVAARPRDRGATTPTSSCWTRIPPVDVANFAKVRCTIRGGQAHLRDRPPAERAGSEDLPADPPGRGRDQRRGRDGQHPGRDDVAGDAPAHGPHALRAADADDGARDRVRGRDRDAEVASRGRARSRRPSPRRSRRPASAW